VDLEGHGYGALRRNLDEARVSLRDHALCRHTKQLKPVWAECEANLRRATANESDVRLPVDAQHVSVRVGVAAHGGCRD
jgi:hypothetical protein